MTEEVTQADRMLAEQWRFIECMHCSQYEGDFVNDLAADFARHRIANQPPAQDGLVEALEVARPYVQNVVDAEGKAFNKRDLAKIDAALSAIKGDKS